MTIECSVEGQKLKIITPLRHYAEKSNDFVDFHFTFSEDWNGLTVYAQFSQGGRTGRCENKLLRDDNTVSLPAWLSPGHCMMVLCGIGNGTVIATTNHYDLRIDPNGLHFEDAVDADVSETLFQQIINRLALAQSEIMQTGEALAELAHDPVPDGYITEDKISPGVMANLKNNYVTPEMFGAVGDGVTDDSLAFERLFAADVDVINITERNKKYLINRPIYVRKRVYMYGNPNSVLSFKGDGCLWIDVTSDSDILGRVKTGNYSHFIGVNFHSCDKCFAGKLIYLFFGGCSFTVCRDVFVCDSERDETVLATWYGALRFNSCFFNYCNRIFKLVNVATGYPLSLNSVDITGGIITHSNFFLQQIAAATDRDKQYNISIRLSAFNVEGADIENTHIFYAIDDSDNETEWVGSVELNSVAFARCYLEHFTLINHGTVKVNDTWSWTIIRSDISIVDSYMNLLPPEKYLIRIADNHIPSDANSILNFVMKNNNIRIKTYKTTMNEYCNPIVYSTANYPCFMLESGEQSIMYNFIEHNIPQTLFLTGSDIAKKLFDVKSTPVIDVHGNGRYVSANRVFQHGSGQTDSTRDIVTLTNGNAAEIKGNYHLASLKRNCSFLSEIPHGTIVPIDRYGNSLELLYISKAAGATKVFHLGDINTLQTVILGSSYNNVDMTASANYSALKNCQSLQAVFFNCDKSDDVLASDLFAGSSNIENIYVKWSNPDDPSEQTVLNTSGKWGAPTTATIHYSYDFN